MSDDVIGTCLHHYNNQHIQLRRDFFDLCAYDRSRYNQRTNEKGKIIKDEPDQECMAKILRLLETLTDHARTNWVASSKKLLIQGIIPKEPQEYAIPLTYGAIKALLYETHGDSVIRNSVATLIARGFIKVFQETKNSIPYYILNITAVQKALHDQAEKERMAVEINSQLGGVQVLKSTSQMLKVTAKPLKSTPQVSKSTAGAVEINNNKKGDEKGKNRNKKEKEREKPPTQQEEKPSSQSLLSSLIQEQLQFWEWWVVVSRCQPNQMNETAYKHVCELAPKMTSLEDLQALYEFAYERIRGIARSKGAKAIPPHLGNLVSAYADWVRSQQEDDLPKKPVETTTRKQSGAPSAKDSTQLTAEEMQWKREQAKAKLAARASA